MPIDRREPTTTRPEPTTPATAPDLPIWLSVRDVAQLLGLSEEGVRWRSRRGLLRGYRAPGTRRLHFRRDEIDAAMLPARTITFEVGGSEGRL